MKKEHILKIAVASITIIFVLYINTLFQEYIVNTKKVTITWQGYNDIENNGYLYMLTDNVMNKNFYVALEREISDEDFMDHRYTFNILDTNEIWNPRLCVKMPSVIDTKGNVFMLDYRFDNKGFKKRLIKYDIQTKEVTFFDLSQMDILGKVYIYKDSVYFFTKEESGVMRNSFLANNNFLERVGVPLHGEGKKIKLSLDNETGTVYFQTIADNLATLNYSYDFETNSLNDVKGVPDRSTTKLIKEKKLQNDSVTYWDILNPYDVGFVIDGIMVPIFKEDADVYGYIIGGF